MPWTLTLTLNPTQLPTPTLVLCQVLCGQLPPDVGTVSVGKTVRLGLVTQSRDALDDGSTVWVPCGRHAPAAPL